MNSLNPPCRIDSLNAFYDFHATVDVLRLDEVHPVVSGNKWFKLQGYLKEATEQKKVVLTFGGAYSNHIVATAAAANNVGLKSIGVIRGERAAVLSPTLAEAESYGMELHFTSRENYRRKLIPETVGESWNKADLYIVPEGGYGLLGAEGAGDILRRNNTGGYTHILTAVGTGTTLAGLVLLAESHQQVIGLSVLKNNLSLLPEIQHLLPAEKKSSFQLLHDYHFGGYAKHTPELLRFMNDLYQKAGIPTDFVYTGKAFFAAFDLLAKSFFTTGDRVLVVHTGGLQGNRSLKKGSLIFSQ